jgi:hypothetical protein
MNAEKVNKTGPNTNIGTEELDAEFQLGDRVYIEGGRFNDTRGRIYYMDDDLIRILPDGAPDRLVDINLTDGELPDDIENFYLISKRTSPAFVAQIDAHVGDVADSFLPDGSLGLQYEIKEVNEEEDFLVLTTEGGDDIKVECAFRGIPLEEPFVVLRPRQKASAAVNSAPTEEEEAKEEESADEGDFFEDIVVEPQEEEEILGLVERPPAERTYPDRVQRDEMFRDMLEALPIREQKSLDVQRRIRQFVEQAMMLRNAVVEYDSTGEPSGSIPTSFQTIYELLKKGDIPLARPVLQANRTLYLDTIEDSPEDNPDEVPGVAVNVQYMQKNVNDSNEFLETKLGGAAGILATHDALPQWYLSWEEFFKRFAQPWTSSGEPGETVLFQGDKEFLRAPVADGLEPAADGLPAPGGGARQRQQRVPGARPL